MSGNENELQPECVGDDGTLTGKERSLANLRRWAKGESGNPLGRAPRRTFIAELAAVLAEPVVEGDLSSPTKMHAVAEKLVELCLSGNVKALAVFLPHVDPQRLRNAIRTTGNVNVLNLQTTGDVESDRDNLRGELDDFVLNLPGLLKANGLPALALGPAIRAVGERFGGISAKAGNGLLKSMLDSDTFPTRDGCSLPDPPEPIVEQVEDAEA
jgi:hypothetical protein